MDSLPAESQGKPKNTGVGSLSLLQRIFPTQELNQGIMHCRQILCQLTYEGSPYELILFIFKNIFLLFLFPPLASFVSKIALIYLKSVIFSR